jgi:hypothetical protein
MLKRIMQVLLREGISEVHHTRDEPASALAGIYPQRLVHLRLASLASELRDIAVEFSEQLRTNP